MTFARRNPRGGFSLAEAMIGMTIMAIAGTVLLLGVETSLRSTIEAEDEAIAAGMAEQLLDEILGHHYTSPIIGDPYQTPLSPSAAEAAGDGRELFDDTDDFHGYSAQPVEDTWGLALGQGDGTGDVRHPDFRLPTDRYSRWRQQVRVYYVNETSPWIELTGSSTSNLRGVEVEIQQINSDGQWKTLAVAKRTFAYVPPPP